MNSNPGSTRPPALALRGVTKTFPGVVAVNDVALEVSAQSIHALIGQNGCGKSTIVKILAGFHTPDAGATGRVDGVEFSLGEAAAAARAGIRVVHQDLAIVGELDALDNVALGMGFHRTRMGTISWDRQRKETSTLLARFGVAVSLDVPLAQASPAERTAVAIVRAIAGGLDGRGLLVLDEPTAALSHREVNSLYSLVREVRDSGTAVLLISHRLDEVLGVADVVSVMRNGRIISEGPIADMSVASMAAMMTGTDESVYVRPSTSVSVKPRDEPPVLSLRGLRGGSLRGVDLDLAAGEVVGVAGLLGSGREELPYAVAGASAARMTGTWKIEGATNSEMSIRRARELGIALVPAERASESTIVELSVGENLTLAILPSLRRRGLISGALVRSFVRGWLDKMDVRANATDQSIGLLSGGNQQRVILARWLSTAPKVMVLAEPTAGVDIGARRALYRLLLAQAAEGLAVLVASSDLQDLLELCDRVLIMRDGLIVTEMTRQDTTEEAIVARMEGVQ